MKQLLTHPELYQLYQNAGGFHGARLKALKAYVDLSQVRRVFDIGCGPGFSVLHVPEGIDYVGFDTDTRYIEYANQKWQGRGRFFNRPFDRSAAEAFGAPDLIMLNGVLHHMDDDTAGTVCRDAAAVLNDEGTFLAIEPCLREGQHPVARILAENDRGEYVRQEAGYAEIARKAFPTSQVHIREDLSWVPFTFAIVTGSN